MEKTLQKHIRVSPEQWQRLEAEATGNALTANQLVVELAMRALDHRDLPRTELEIQLLRSAMFTAQPIARDMEKAGRQDEIEKIRRDISEIAPEFPSKPELSTADSSVSRGNSV